MGTGCSRGNGSSATESVNQSGHAPTSTGGTGHARVFTGIALKLAFATAVNVQIS